MVDKLMMTPSVSRFSRRLVELRVKIAREASHGLLLCCTLFEQTVRSVQLQLFIHLFGRILAFSVDSHYLFVKSCCSSTKEIRCSMDSGHGVASSVNLKISLTRRLSAKVKKAVDRYSSRTSEERTRENNKSIALP